VTPDEYLAQVERGLCGSRSARRRLIAELRAHLEDSLAAGHSEAEAIERAGAADEVVKAWRAHALSIRAQNRRRGSVLALAVATTAALGIAQHASGHRPPPAPCAPAQHPASSHCPR
jgi:uncharacterized membrane protein